MIDLTGKRLGRLTVLSRSPVYHKKNVPLWNCKCDCGKETLVRGEYLRYRHTLSCGCYKLQRISETKFIHGMSQSNEHSIWRKMHDRCYKSYSGGWMRYGGRGIKICDRWLHGENGLNGFQCFYADVGPRPSKAHTLDRVDNDGDYAPDNVKWATRKEQAVNKHNNLRFEWNGGTLTLSQICELENVRYGLALSRVRVLGWSIQRAILTPAGPNNRKKAA